MTVEGFAEYKRREFCKDVKCPVQIELTSLSEASPAYEQTRKKCSAACLFTTWQFHRWLIEKGYVVLISEKMKDDERTVLVNLDKALVDWVDQQVGKGKHKDRQHLIENALAQYKIEHEKQAEKRQT
jgi:hypothetical protein